MAPISNDIGKLLRRLSMNTQWNWYGKNEESIKQAEELKSLDGATGHTLRDCRAALEVVTMQILATVDIGPDMPLTSVPAGHRESLIQSINDY